MGITEAQVPQQFGCFLIVGFLLSYPALTTGIALMRTERSSRRAFLASDYRSRQ
jgi:hypothetical protein